METILLIAKELLQMVLVAAVVASVSYLKGYKEDATYAMTRIYEIIEKNVEELKLKMEEALGGK